jgi:hypothetical protein
MTHEEEKRRDDKIRELRRQFSEMERVENDRYNELKYQEEKMKHEFEEKKRK